MVNSQQEFSMERRRVKNILGRGARYLNALVMITVAYRRERQEMNWSLPLTKLLSDFTISDRINTNSLWRWSGPSMCQFFFTLNPMSHHISCPFAFTSMALFYSVSIWSPDPSGSCSSLRLPSHPPQIILIRIWECGEGKRGGRGDACLLNTDHLLKYRNPYTICIL